MAGTQQGQASLEQLIESEDLNVEILHPGGLDITREVAGLCRIGEGVSVLEVACGTGETACLLASEFGARVVGVDHSRLMIERAKEKARRRGLDIEFQVADAHNLPFDDNSFHAVLSECSVCHFDKEKALQEMARVAKAGGSVGIHDLCWNEQTPEELKQRLAEIEQEWPETADDWGRQFKELGLVDVRLLDRSGLLSVWTKDFKKRLGVWGYISAIAKILKRWGIGGLRRILESERIFASKHLGYVIIVGTKP